jgi:hypothetical protein
MNEEPILYCCRVGARESGRCGPRGQGQREPRASAAFVSVAQQC